ncbi:unnamed protein product, partial [Ilex paraguariensis]
AHYPYFTFLYDGTPPIALAISYGSSSSQPQGPARSARPKWAQRSTSILIMLGVLLPLPDLERYYKSSVPDSITTTIWFISTIKEFHAYITVTNDFITLDHEDPSRASGWFITSHLSHNTARIPLKLSLLSVLVEK